MTKKKVNVFLVIIGVLSIQVVGCPLGDSVDCTARVEEYDPETNKWTRKANLPVPLHEAAATELNGQIYVMGGIAGDWDNREISSKVFKYNPVTDTWTQVANMPTPRANLAACSINGKIYAIGGIPPPPSGGAVPIVEEYDPSTDTWTWKTDIPTSRWHFCVAVLSEEIYVIGGRWDNCDLSTVEKYDPATDTWTTVSDMPIARRGPLAESVAGKIYVIGGRYKDQQLMTVEEYNPVTDEWTQKAGMPTIDAGLEGSAVVYDKIYVILKTYKDILVREYDPATDTWKDMSKYKADRATTCCAAANEKIYWMGGIIH